MPSPAKTPKAAQAPAPEPQDPLADLREDDVDDLLATELRDDRPTPPLLEDADGAPFPPDVQEAFALAMASAVLVTQDSQDDLRATIIAAWHADSVALGFLHKGGRCGCNYIAGVALRAAVPVVPDPEFDQAED